MICIARGNASLKRFPPHPATSDFMLVNSARVTSHILASASLEVDAL